MNLSFPLYEGYYRHDNIKLSHSRFNLNWCKELGITPKVVFDIGSCDLGDSWRFREKFGCEVYSFEASPERFDICRKYAEQLSIQVYNYVVYDRLTWIPFYQSFDRIQGESGSQGSLFQHTDAYKNNFRHITQQKEAVVVPTITVKDFCLKREITEIDVAHIDVEGAEYHVVNGFGPIRPKIVFVETLDENFWTKIPSIEQTHNKVIEMGYKFILDIGSDRLYVFNG